MAKKIRIVIEIPEEETKYWDSRKDGIDACRSEIHQDIARMLRRDGVTAFEIFSEVKED